MQRRTHVCSYTAYLHAPQVAYGRMVAQQKYTPVGFTAVNGLKDATLIWCVCMCVRVCARACVCVCVCLCAR